MQNFPVPANVVHLGSYNVYAVTGTSAKCCQGQVDVEALANDRVRVYARGNGHSYVHGNLVDICSGAEKANIG